MALEFNLTLNTNNPSGYENESEHENNKENSNPSMNSILCNEGAKEVSWFDAFCNKDPFGTPDFSNMNLSLFATAPQIETIGSVAYMSNIIDGSIAFASAETIGSVACFSGSDFGFSCGISADSGSFSGDSGGSFSSFC